MFAEGYILVMYILVNVEQIVYYSLWPNGMESIITSCVTLR